MISKEFVLAGKAVFTVWKASDHFTFKVKRHQRRGSAKSSGAGHPYFVFCHRQPPGAAYSSERTMWTYLGVIWNDLHETGRVKLTRKSEVQEGNQMLAVASWILRKIWKQTELPEGYHVANSGRCGRCGRVLTDPVSLQVGLGPECRGWLRPAATQVYDSGAVEVTRGHKPEQLALEYIRTGEEE